MFFNREPKPKKILDDRRYTQTRITNTMLHQALNSEISNSATNLNIRMVNNKYAVPILNSLDNVFYYEDTFFTPTGEQTKDVTMRKNAQNCLKILFDYTNLQYKDIFNLLSTEDGQKLWINNEKIDPNRDAITIACNVLGLDKIFKKERFRGLKTKIDKLKHLNKPYELKATIFSKLVECNKELQNVIFSSLRKEPCRYSEKFNTRFEAKQMERKQKIMKERENPSTEATM